MTPRGIQTGEPCVVPPPPAYRSADTRYLWYILVLGKAQCGGICITVRTTSTKDQMQLVELSIDARPRRGLQSRNSTKSAVPSAQNIEAYQQYRQQQQHSSSSSSNYSVAAAEDEIATTAVWLFGVLFFTSACVCNHGFALSSTCSEHSHFHHAVQECAMPSVRSGRRKPVFLRAVDPTLLCIAPCVPRVEDWKCIGTTCQPLSRSQALFRPNRFWFHRVENHNAFIYNGNPFFNRGAR